MIKSTSLFALILIVFSCSENKSQNNSKDFYNPIEKDNSEEQFDPINPNGSIIKTRFNLPKGYERVISDSNSFGSYLQNLPLKKDGSLVHLQIGRAHV